MKTKDCLQKFMFDKAEIRGQIIHLDDAYQTIVKQRDYPPMVQYLLGEALTSAALMMGSIKFEGEINLQFHGDERLPLILVQCNHNFEIRGFAKYKEDLQTKDYAKAFLNGKMVVTMKPYHTTEAFQSVVPLISTSMSENLAHYFTQSEQITTQVYFAASEHHIAGLLIQLLPTEKSEDREEFWNYAQAVTSTITEEELLNLDNTTILHRLFNEVDVRLYDELPIQFKCRCTLDKMLQAIKMLGQAEVDDIFKTHGHVDVTCDFCNHLYVFKENDVMHLFKTLH